jgi:hypothetical protein
VFPHLEALRVRVVCGIPHSKDSLSLFMVQYSKVTNGFFEKPYKTNKVQNNVGVIMKELSTIT